MLAPLVALLLLAGSSGLRPAEADTVTVATGQLRGSDGAIRVFRGIPFAAPPVGSLRWRPPQPAARWAGVRDATRFGNDCMQAPWDVMSGQPDSEDCLFLNVWTPSHRATDRLPVMVFIYGGAFVGGSGALKLYDGAALAARGVLVVTLNYRLGVLGFLAHPALTAESPQHSSGNYGLLDQVAALRWVRANIDRFGGDPGRVTIFGESAGGTSVSMLLVAPSARGLFQRAIAESPALGWRLSTLAEAEAAGQAALGPDLAALRQMPASRLIAENMNISAAPPRTAPAAYPFPIVDGWLIPEQPDAVLAAGRVDRVPLIVGDNADEGTMFGDQWHLSDGNAYQARLHEVFGALSGDAARLYPAASPLQVARAGADIVGDATFYLGARLLAQGMHKAGAASYRYLFTHPSGHVPLHSDELRSVFGTLGTPGFTHQAAPDAADRQVSALVMGAWTRFAATGNPDGGQLPHWAPVGASGDPLMVLDTAPKLASGFRSRQLDFMERFFAGSDR